MANEEIRHITPSKNFSSRDKAKIISSVIKVVPKEYMEQFYPAADAQFGAKQASLLHVSGLGLRLSFIGTQYCS